MLDYDVVRQGDPTLGEPELTTATAATQALSRQVAALGAPDGADAGDPGLVLGSFGIRWVLLPGPIDPALAQRLDAAVGLVLLSTSSSYDLWQVAGPVGRVRVVAPDGTVTVLASDPLDLSGVSVPAAGGTLVLAEPYGGWTATLNGRALRPITTPVDGWAQGFALPSGGGQLSITRNNLAREASLLAELVVLLAVCVLALPGKRADPVEEADALAALREARDAKRGARGQLRREADDSDDLGADELPETVPVAEWPVGETASGPGVAGLAAQDFPDDGDEDQAPGDQGQSEHGDGDHGRGGHGLGEERAPWDMAGDWGSSGRRPDPDPWGDDPWGQPGAAQPHRTAGGGVTGHRPAAGCFPAVLDRLRARREAVGRRRPGRAHGLESRHRGMGSASRAEPVAVSPPPEPATG